MARLSIFFCLITLCMYRDVLSGQYDAQYLALRQRINATGDEGPDCVCSRIYDPVCGTDEKSYLNMCQMQCQATSNVTVAYQGYCIPF